MGIGFDHFQKAFQNNAKGIEDKYFVEIHDDLRGDGVKLQGKSGWINKSVRPDDQNEANFGLRQKFLDAMGTKLNSNRYAVEGRWLSQLRDSLGLGFSNAGNEPKVLSARLVFDNIQALKVYGQWKDAFNSFVSRLGLENEKYLDGFEAFLKEELGETKDKLQRNLNFAELPDCTPQNIHKLEGYLKKYAKEVILPGYGLPKVEDIEKELVTDRHTKELTPEQRKQVDDLKAEVTELWKLGDKSLGKEEQVKKAIGDVMVKYADLYVDRLLTRTSFSMEKYLKYGLMDNPEWKKKSPDEKDIMLKQKLKDYSVRLKELARNEFQDNFKAKNWLFERNAVDVEKLSEDLRKEKKGLGLAPEKNNHGIPEVKQANENIVNQAELDKVQPKGNNQGAEKAQIDLGNILDKWALSDEQMEKVLWLSETFMNEAKPFLSGKSDPQRVYLSLITVNNYLKHVSNGNEIDFPKLKNFLLDTAVEACGKGNVSKDKLAFVAELKSGSVFENAMKVMEEVAKNPQDFDKNGVKKSEGMKGNQSNIIKQLEQEMKGENAGGKNVVSHQNVVEDNNLDNREVVIPGQHQPEKGVIYDQAKDGPQDKSKSEAKFNANHDDNLMDGNNNNINPIGENIDKEISAKQIQEHHGEGVQEVRNLRQEDVGEMSRISTDSVLAAYSQLLDGIPGRSNEFNSLDFISDMEKRLGGKNVSWLSEGNPLVPSRQEPRIPNQVKDYFLTKDPVNGPRMAVCLSNLLRQNNLEYFDKARKEAGHPLSNELELMNPFTDVDVVRTRDGAYEIAMSVEAAMSKIKGGEGNGQDKLLEPDQSKISYKAKFKLTFGQNGEPRLEALGETEVKFQKKETTLTQTQMDTLTNFADPVTGEKFGRNAIWNLAALNDDGFKNDLDNLAKPGIQTDPAKLKATKEKVARFLRDKTITEEDEKFLLGLGLGRREVIRLLRGRIPGVHLTKANILKLRSAQVEERRQAMLELKELQQKQLQLGWNIHANLLEDRVVLTVEGGVKGSYDELFSDLRLAWDYLDNPAVEPEEKKNVQEAIAGLGDKEATVKAKIQHADTLNQFLVGQRKALGLSYLHAFPNEFSTHDVEILTELGSLPGQAPLKKSIDDNMQLLYEQKDADTVTSAIDALKNIILANAVRLLGEQPGQDNLVQGDEQGDWVNVNLKEG